MAAPRDIAVRTLAEETAGNPPAPANRLYRGTGDAARDVAHPPEPDEGFMAKFMHYLLVALSTLSV
jgi:hypothetical protein